MKIKQQQLNAQKIKKKEKEIQQAKRLIAK